MNGYLPHVLKKINLKKGILTKFDYIFDFTKGPLIHGVIKIKNNKIKPLMSVSLKEIKFLGKFFENPLCKTKKIGDNKYINEFWWGGLEPGNYKLAVGYIDVINDKPIPKFIDEILTIVWKEHIELRFTL